MITPRAISRIRKDHPEISIEFLKHIAEYISDPLMIFKSDTQEKSLVVVTEVMTNTGPVVVPMKIDTTLKNNEIHRIPSSYIKENFTRILSKWLDKGLLRYIDERRARKIFRSGRVQFPMEEILFSSSIHTLVRKTSPVKNSDIRFSTTEEASAARQLADRWYPILDKILRIHKDEP